MAGNEWTIFDADAEDVGELGKDVGTGRYLVGARRLVALLPEGDVLLWLADEAGELGLAEGSGFAEGDEPGALSGR